MDQNNERLEELLRSGSYSELSSSDRNWVDENLGEKAFTELQAMMTDLHEEQEMTVSHNVKKELVADFKSQNETAFDKLIGLRMPAYAVVLLLLAVGSIYFLLPEKERVLLQTVEVAGEPVIDTVFVEQPADTVFVELERRVPVYVTKYVDREPVQVESPTVTVNEKSLADQKELRSLLSEVGAD